MSARSHGVVRLPVAGLHLGVLGTVLVFVGARPVLRAGAQDSVVLRSPVREHVLPLDAVEVDDTGKRLALLHEGRRYVVWATERMNYESSEALSA